MMTEEVIEVAQDWRRVKLKDVAEKPQYGITASAAKAGAVKFLRITDISDQGVDWDTVPYCEASSDAIRSCLLCEGDVVFARIGATTGKSYLIKDPPNAVFASYLIRVRARKGLDPVFLSHFFKSDGYWEQIDANKHANLKKGVNGSILSELEVPLPPLPEQQRIAQVLSTVQEAIAQQERLIRTTTELKQALMQKLFTEGLRGETLKETEIGRVPESWEVVRFEEMATLQRGADLPRSSFIQGNVPVCGSSGIMGYHAEHNTVGPGVTVGRSGSVGKVNYYSTPFWAHNTCLYVRDFHGHDPRFVAYYMEHLNLRRFSTGTSVPTLDRNSFKALPIALPPHEQQLEGAKALQMIDSKIADIEKKQATLQDLFRTLLHELMTGKVRVGELDQVS